jgi:hypothetical protein
MDSGFSRRRRGFESRWDRVRQHAMSCSLACGRGGRCTRPAWRETWGGSDADSAHPLQVPWSSGTDTALSQRRPGFDPRWDCVRPGRVAGDPRSAPVGRRINKCPPQGNVAVEPSAPPSSVLMEWPDMLAVRRRTRAPRTAGIGHWPSWPPVRWLAPARSGRCSQAHPAAADRGAAYSSTGRAAGKTLWVRVRVPAPREGVGGWSSPRKRTPWAPGSTAWASRAAPHHPARGGVACAGKGEPLDLAVRGFDSRRPLGRWSRLG